jgi:hypothetical protein
MERKDEFKLFKVQQNLTFKTELTKPELEAAFDTLIKIPYFDGAKIIDDRRQKHGGGTYIKITTVDNKSVLDVNGEDMTLSYLFDIFHDVPEQSQLDFFKRFQSIITELGREIDYARYRRTWIGDTPELRKATIAHVMSPPYAEKVDELDLELDLTEKESPEPLDPSHFAKVTTLHTTEMHDQFEKNEQEKRLDTLIVVDEYRVIGEGLTIKDVDGFLKSEASRKVTGPEI